MHAIAAARFSPPDFSQIETRFDSEYGVLWGFMNPKPRVALPGYIGLRLEDDQRWQKFLDRWSEWNILLGHNERRMREALAKDGLEVPSTVSFSPN